MTGDEVVFLVGPDQTLITMLNQPYDSEDLLQTIVERYPEILAGGSEGAAKRLALVKREQPVADVQGSKGRWSLDHLFVDNEGIPTLVEVKRSTDTRIRREVVGQMLDYAANGVSYWSIADLQVRFESTHAATGSKEVLNTLMGKPTDPAEFWQTVEDNLTAGRIRMVFLADEVPRELQRIIEFLNEQMARAEVIGVEVRQYVGGGHQTLVPRILGATARSEQVKGSGPKRRYDDLIAEAPEYVRGVEANMRAWAEQGVSPVEETNRARHRNRVGRRAHAVVSGSRLGIGRTLPFASEGPGPRCRGRLDPKSCVGAGRETSDCQVAQSAMSPASFVLG